MPKNILLTCGLGDFIALDSYLNVREIYDVENIYWATRARESIMPLIPHVFPNAKNHIIVQDNWNKDECIEYKGDLQNKEINLNNVEDYSISVLFNDILKNRRSYQGSSLIRKKLCNIDHLNLPEKYIVVHPYSENARTELRDITACEWLHIQRHILDKGIKIVVLNQGSEQVLPHDNLIDLTNKTNIIEAIEVVKMSIGFLGASSVFSVIASKVMPYWKMQVKGHNLLKDIYWKFYYAPLDNNTFISNTMLRVIPFINFSQ